MVISRKPKGTTNVEEAEVGRWARTRTADSPSRGIKAVDRIGRYSVLSAKDFVHRSAKDASGSIGGCALCNARAGSDVDRDYVA